MTPRFALKSAKLAPVGCKPCTPRVQILHPRGANLAPPIYRTYTTYPYLHPDTPQTHAERGNN
jgi:hypothetical protein